MVVSVLFSDSESSIGLVIPWMFEINGYLLYERYLENHAMPCCAASSCGGFGSALFRLEVERCGRKPPRSKVSLEHVSYANRMKRSLPSPSYPSRYSSHSSTQNHAPDPRKSTRKSVMFRRNHPKSQKPTLISCGISVFSPIKS